MLLIPVIVVQIVQSYVLGDGEYRLALWDGTDNRALACVTRQDGFPAVGTIVPVHVRLPLLREPL